MAYVERAGNFHAIRSKFEFLAINPSAKIAPTNEEQQEKECGGQRRKPTRQGSFTYGSLGRNSPTSMTPKGLPVSVLIAREMAARSSTRAQRDSGYNSFTLATPARERSRTANYRLFLRPTCNSVHPTSLHAAKSPSPPVSPRACMPSPTLRDMQQFTRSMNNLAISVPYTLSTASVSEGGIVMSRCVFDFHLQLVCLIC